METGPTAIKKLPLLLSKKKELVLSNPRRDSSKIQWPQEFTENFEIIEKIGQGFQGVVYSVKSKKTEEVLAAKVYNTFDEEAISKIANEKNIYSKLNHEAFPAFKAYIEDSRAGYYIIITEFYQFLSLEKFLSSCQINASETNKIILQIKEALRFLHEMNISHRDFNPTNILINPSTFSIKVIDFGLSKILKNTDMVELEWSEGNQKYRAPECSNMNEPFYEDLWGFSCIALSLYCHQKINSKNMISLLDLYKKNKKHFLNYEENYEEINEIMEVLLITFN